MDNLEITCKVNGQEIPLSDVSEETLLAVREQSKCKHEPFEKYVDGIRVSSSYKDPSTDGLYSVRISIPSSVYGLKTEYHENASNHVPGDLLSLDQAGSLANAITDCVNYVKRCRSSE
jgi:hypothetical protein